MVENYTKVVDFLEKVYENAIIEVNEKPTEPEEEKKQEDLPQAFKVESKEEQVITRYKADSEEEDEFHNAEAPDEEAEEEDEFHDALSDHAALHTLSQ